MSAISKSKALLRHKTIDACLRNVSRKYSLNDLILQCTRTLSKSLKSKEKISLRTMQADIEFMRDPVNGYGAPIEVYEKKYYRYSNPDFSLGNLTIKKNISDPTNSADDFPAGCNGSLKELLSKLDAVISTEEFSYLKDAFKNLASEYFAHEEALAAARAADEEEARRAAEQETARIATEEAAGKAAEEQAAHEAEEAARKASEDAARETAENSMNHRSVRYASRKKKEAEPDLFSDLF